LFYTVAILGPGRMGGGTGPPVLLQAYLWEVAGCGSLPHIFNYIATGRGRGSATSVDRQL